MFGDEAKGEMEGTRAPDFDLTVCPGPVPWETGSENLRAAGRQFTEDCSWEHVRRVRKELRKATLGREKDKL